MVVGGIFSGILILSCVFILNIQWYFIALIGVLAFLVFTLGTGFIFGFLDLDNHRAINVINQLKQYPANEQWVVISKYADNLLLKSPYNREKDNLETLASLCRKNKFGLLLISSKKVEVRVYAVEKKGDFLKNYCKEGEILKELQTQSEAVKMSI